MRLIGRSRAGLGMRSARPAVVPRAAAPTASPPVVGFVADQTDSSRQQDGTTAELLDAAGVVTLKERVMQTDAFRAFQGAIENKVRQAGRPAHINRVVAGGCLEQCGWCGQQPTPSMHTLPEQLLPVAAGSIAAGTARVQRSRCKHPSAFLTQSLLSIALTLHAVCLTTCANQPVLSTPCPSCMQSSLYSDWLSFTSRPWVQGPVDAFLGNTHLAAMMSQHRELAATVEGLVAMLDAALTKVGVASVGVGTSFVPIIRVAGVASSVPWDRIWVPPPPSSGGG